MNVGTMTGLGVLAGGAGVVGGAVALEHFTDDFPGAGTAFAGAVGLLVGTAALGTALLLPGKAGNAPWGLAIGAIGTGFTALLGAAIVSLAAPSLPT